VVLTATVFIRQTRPRQLWGPETVATVGMPTIAASSAATGGDSSDLVTSEPELIRRRTAWMLWLPY
jgi:hypothetical protein